MEHIENNITFYYSVFIEKEVKITRHIDVHGHVWIGDGYDSPILHAIGTILCI